MSEEKIHRLYRKIIDKHSRQGVPVKLPRTNYSSFSSTDFNIGEGIKVLTPSETVILAALTLPAQYSGVLTGYSQDFVQCVNDQKYQVRWAIRVFGRPVQGYPDFIGEYSSLANPAEIKIRLTGGDTLGRNYLSLNSTDNFANGQTAVFQATNLSSSNITLQGRLLGYFFPTAETPDQFANF